MPAKCADYLLGFTLPVWMLKLTALLISNFSFVAATMFLFLLSRKVTLNYELSRLSAALFCITPAGIFMSAVYSESVYSLFSFAGMYFWLCDSQWLAMICFGASTATRSNGTLLAGFFLYDLLHILLKPDGRISGLKRLAAAGQCLARVLFTVAPFYAHQYFRYKTFCENSNDGFPSASFCTSIGFHSLYAYLEHKYWGIGLFQFYTVRQLPNFLIAAPTIALCAYGVISSVLEAPAIVASACLIVPERTASKTILARQTRSCVFVWYLAGMLVIALCVMHIQVINRFVVACPAMYWTAASIILKHPSSFISFCIIWYFILWNVLGCLLFCNFYPWT